MSRFVLTTFGSLGDLHPYVAVALELKSRGHDAVLATSANYRAKIEALGIAFHALRPDLSHVTSDPELMRRVMDLRRGAEVVVRELTSLLDNPSVVARAAAVGRTVAGENGARTAADALERLASS